jgi:hypothetical protein
MGEDQSPAEITSNMERATKMARTFAAQVETLTRYRGKGQQKMTVEHVHVGQGGQAIIGDVITQGRPTAGGDGGPNGEK